MTKKATTKVFKKPVRASNPPRRAPAGPSQDSQKMALAAAAAGLDKKAIDVEIIDVTGKVDYADYLVLMSGRSDRHVVSIADGIDEALSRLGVQPYHREGKPADGWLLLDYGDVVAHIFAPVQRDYYGLEKLWQTATTVVRVQ